MVSIQLCLELIGRVSVLKSHELVSLRDSYATCEKSNKLMEDELVLRDDKIRLLEEIADNRAAEVERLKRRGFWARVFNR